MVQSKSHGEEVTKEKKMRPNSKMHYISSFIDFIPYIVFWGVHHLTLGMIVTKNRLLRHLHFLCELLGLKIEKEGWKGESTLQWLKIVVTDYYF